MDSAAKTVGGGSATRASHSASPSESSMGTSASPIATQLDVSETDGLDQLARAAQLEDKRSELDKAKKELKELVESDPLLQEYDNVKDVVAAARTHKKKSRQTVRIPPCTP